MVNPWLSLLIVFGFWFVVWLICTTAERAKETSRRNARFDEFIKNQYQ